MSDKAPLSVRGWPYNPKSRKSRNGVGRDGGGKTRNKRAVWWAKMNRDGTESRTDAPRGKKQRKPWSQP